MDIGQGWATEEEHTWTANQLIPNCPNPSNQTIQCGDHVTPISLSPSQSTGSIQVRATLTVDLLSCNNCIPNTGDPSSAGGQIWVFDIRIIAETPTLTVSPTTPTRGDTVTFEVVGAPAATIDEWRFSTLTLGIVDRTSGTGNATWPGTLVAAGTASVRVVLLGTTYNLSKEVSVLARNWAWTPKTPLENSSLIAMPDPPYSGSTLGYFTLYMDTWFASHEISDNGPNHGFKYVTVLTEAPGLGHVYYYQIHPKLSDTTSTFYSAQCGTSGFIDGAVLLSNTLEHEMGSTLGHYKNYIDALGDPDTNPGVFAEKQVAGPATSKSTFDTTVDAGLDTRVASIGSAASSHVGVCNAIVNYDTSCVNRGSINYSPYTPC